MSESERHFGLDLSANEKAGLFLIDQSEAGLWDSNLASECIQVIEIDITVNKRSANDWASSRNEKNKFHKRDFLCLLQYRTQSFGFLIFYYKDRTKYEEEYKRNLIIKEGIIERDMDQFYFWDNSLLYMCLDYFTTYYLTKNSFTKIRSIVLVRRISENWVTVSIFNTK